MSSDSRLRVFTTQPHSCSYLPNNVATTLFVDPLTRIDKTLYSRLSDFGFRRSGRHIYTPHCSNCSACIPARVLAEAFVPNRAQRRIIKRNSDLEFHYYDSIDSDECYELYDRYISLRHKDGDMYPPTREQYENFLTSEWGVTQYIGLKKQDELKALMVTDVLDNGLSAVYTFFDPQEDRRSLGSYGILSQINLAAKHLNLPYVYLGYWIKDCAKMNYKTAYQPLELYINGDWVSHQDTVLI